MWRCCLLSLAALWLTSSPASAADGRVPPRTVGSTTSASTVDMTVALWPVSCAAGRAYGEATAIARSASRSTLGPRFPRGNFGSLPPRVEPESDPSANKTSQEGEEGVTGTLKIVVICDVRHKRAVEVEIRQSCAIGHRGVYVSQKVC